MRIKDALAAGSFIPRNNNTYNSDEWYLATVSKLDSFLRRLQGNREIFEDLTAYTGTMEDPAGSLPALTGAVDMLMELNCYKYRHLWKLYIAEYNPLWNVDGTEKTTRTRDNSGTQENKLSGSDELEKLGKEKSTRTGNETTAPDGSETMTKAGSITTANSGGPTSSRTTFDSATFYDTDKTVDTGKQATTYGEKNGASDPYTETKSFSSDRKDTHTYNDVADELSFTNRSDKTTYGKTDTRTDNLHENEVIIHERGGNIGVTMTTQLEQSEVDFVQMFRLIEEIVADIAGAISYVF